MFHLNKIHKSACRKKHKKNALKQEETRKQPYIKCFVADIFLLRIRQLYNITVAANENKLQAKVFKFKNHKYY